VLLNEHGGGRGGNHADVEDSHGDLFSATQGRRLTLTLISYPFHLGM
jgi:hypothetical protein